MSSEALDADADDAAETLLCVLRSAMRDDDVDDDDDRDALETLDGVDSLAPYDPDADDVCAEAAEAADDDGEEDDAMPRANCKSSAQSRPRARGACAPDDCCRRRCTFIFAAAMLDQCFRPHMAPRRSRQVPRQLVALLVLLGLGLVAVLYSISGSLLFDDGGGVVPTSPEWSAAGGPLQDGGRAGGALQESLSDGRWQHVIIIDAGSSGSRIHVWKYRMRNIKGHMLPEFDREQQTLKVKPGLSSFASNPRAAVASLQPLVDFAHDHVPGSLRSSALLYLKGTAGLRSITPDQAENVLVAVREMLRRTPFAFQHAEVTPGSHEGAFGWISANYLFGNLEPMPSAGGLDLSTIGQTTLGVIELGGASMQVTFEPDTRVPVSLEDEYLFKFKFGPRAFAIYTHSFLGYGQEAALRSLVAHEQYDANQRPCHPKQSADDTAGDFDKCRSLVRSLFRKDAPTCPVQQSCSFNGVYQPPLAGEDFVAIENFYWTSKFFGVLDRPDSFAAMANRAQGFCAAPLEESLVKYRDSKESRDNIANKFCFSSAYITEVLQYGLGIVRPDGAAKIVHTVKGTELDWSLGAAIFELTLRVGL